MAKTSSWFHDTDHEIQLKRKKTEQEADLAVAIKLYRILGDNSLFF